MGNQPGCNSQQWDGFYIHKTHMRFLVEVFFLCSFVLFRPVLWVVSLFKSITLNTLWLSPCTTVEYVWLTLGASDIRSISLLTWLKISFNLIRNFSNVCLYRIIVSDRISTLLQVCNFCPQLIYSCEIWFVKSLIEILSNSSSIWCTHDCSQQIRGYYTAYPWHYHYIASLPLSGVHVLQTGSIYKT